MERKKEKLFKAVQRKCSMRDEKGICKGTLRGLRCDEGMCDRINAQYEIEERIKYGV